MKKTVHSPLALGVIALIVIAFLSWLAITQQSAIKETSDVGGQGIKKVQEVKLELELPPDQAQP